VVTNDVESLKVACIILNIRSAYCAPFSRDNSLAKHQQNTMYSLLFWHQIASLYL